MSGKQEHLARSFDMCPRIHFLAVLHVKTTLTNPRECVIWTRSWTKSEATDWDLTPLLLRFNNCKPGL